ncbi:MAG: SEC-C domain-containing protein [Candidatus Omnitrophica bacterium]|nr:SEC-C domain-containing protein [Candidatus Omnitrophota bacterium]
MDEQDFDARLKITGRNDQCPCGSGKKYKKCHLAKDETAQQKELLKQKETAEQQENAGDANDKKKSRPTHFNTEVRPKHTHNKSFGRQNVPRRPAGSS